MDMAEALKLEKLRGELKRNEPMARHASWRAGGAVSRAYVPADLADLAVFMRTLPAEEPVHFVGLGSNLLVRDRGLNGTVIFTHRALRAVRLERAGADGGTVYGEAGAAGPKVARFAALHGLSGAEFLVGIPGTLGGALAMNAGCFGAETWDIVEQVTTIARDGALRERTPRDYRIGYRTVVRQGDGPEEWFVAARLLLPKGVKKESLSKIKDLLVKRLATQPLDEPNAGSVFRNPGGDHAARLIEACGLKGHAVGGARISGKHANFIVNPGGASAADIEALIELAEKRVREKFGIALEREVRIIGEK
ncbi:MAG: UDP-N-acetylmuramate dehydrogenase [Betaproteobacteria bacterium]|nr:UDP-N-acetylmuramate dehydrogenase [Betaproteobacteria bacterium]